MSGNSENDDRQLWQKATGFIDTQSTGQRWVLAIAGVCLAILVAALLVPYEAESATVSYNTPATIGGKFYAGGPYRETVDCKGVLYELVSPTDEGCRSEAPNQARLLLPYVAICAIALGIIYLVATPRREKWG
jgi:hypothetical protein